MTQFVIKIDTSMQRIGISYTGDGPQTDLAVGELDRIARAYEFLRWEEMRKACNDAIYYSREKPHFDPNDRVSWLKVLAILLLAFAGGFLVGVVV